MANSRLQMRLLAAFLGSLAAYSIPLHSQEERNHRSEKGTEKFPPNFYSELQLNSTSSTRSNLMDIISEYYGQSSSIGNFKRDAEAHESYRQAMLAKGHNMIHAYEAKRSGGDWGTECYRWGKLTPKFTSDKPIAVQHQIHSRLKRQSMRIWSVKDVLYVVGGCQGGDVESCYDDVWSMNTTTKQWLPKRLSNTPTSSSPVLQVKGQAWGFDANLSSVFSFGGITSQGYSQSLSVLAPLSPSSKPTNPNSIPFYYKELQCTGMEPKGVEGASLAIIRTSTPGSAPLIVIFGGNSDEGFSNSLTVTSAGRLDTCHWRYPKPDGPKPSPRFGHSVAVVNNKMYMFGGTDYSSVFSDLWVLTATNEKTFSWTQLSSPTSLSGGVAFSSLSALPGLKDTGDLLYLFGGCGVSGCTNNLTIFDVKANSWKSPPPSLLNSHNSLVLMPESRGKHSAVWIQSMSSEAKILAIVGGCGQGRCYGSIVNYLDIDAICSSSSCAAGQYSPSSVAHIQDTAVLASCSCEVGFTGKHCDREGIDYCPKNCSGNGFCKHQCVCKPGFFGADCAKRSCPNDCTNPEQGSCDDNKGVCNCAEGFWGPDCTFPMCPRNCTGHGICALTSFSFNATRQQTSCICQDGYSAEDCSVASGDSRGIARKVSGYCLSHCSGHGICQRDHVLLSSNALRINQIDSLLEGSSVNPTAIGAASSLTNKIGGDDEVVETSPYCACERGFDGEGCETECPLFCSGRGICRAGECICDKGFAGMACEEKYCIDNCLGRGTCNNGTCTCDSGYSGEYCQLDVSCEGHGKLTNGTCLCDKGWGGFDCSLKIECPDDCNGRGRCRLAGPVIASADFASSKGSEDSGVYEGSCDCNPGFTGPSCKELKCVNDCSGKGYCSPKTGKCECYSGYSTMDCSVEVECPNNCTGTHGICKEDGKCSCNDGWTGLSCEKIGCPNDCSGHGECKDGKCRCEEGYSGVSCRVTCDQGCVHGQCQDGNCICDVFHYGVDCNKTKVCPTTTGLPCSGNGICDKTSGKCTCQPGYDGEACERGRMCPGNCHNHGHCVVGECQCDPQWTGPACLDRPKCPGNCSTNGLCLNSGSCLCFRGFSGPDCSTFSTDHSCPSDCNNKGVCFEGKCYCAPGHHGTACEKNDGCDEMLCKHGICAFGKCFCNPGWGGSNCTQREVCPGGCVNGNCTGGKCHCWPGFSGISCKQTWECPKGCSGRGVCISGACACLPGYSGGMCEVVKTPAPKCPSNCNNRGRCHLGQCHCLPGFQGLGCEIKSATTSCGNGCSGNGRCYLGQCFCNPGFEGDICEQKKKCPKDCRNNGVCGHGKCFCVAGWTGEDCSERTNNAERLKILEESLVPPHPKCPGACSGHGVCVSGRCYCETGYGGPACAYIDGTALTHRCPNNCSDHGECLLGKCFCYPPHSGRDCSTRRAVPCPSDCNGHGVCSHGKCFCDPGYKGISCGVTETTCDPECDMGVCISGTCRCIKNFTGAACTIPMLIKPPAEVLDFRSKHLNHHKKTPSKSTDERLEGSKPSRITSVLQETETEELDTRERPVVVKAVTDSDQEESSWDWAKAIIFSLALAVAAVACILASRPAKNVKIADCVSRGSEKISEITSKDLQNMNDRDDTNPDVNIVGPEEKVQTSKRSTCLGVEKKDTIDTAAAPLLT